MLNILKWYSMYQAIAARALFVDRQFPHSFLHWNSYFLQALERVLSGYLLGSRMGVFIKESHSPQLLTKSQVAEASAWQMNIPFLLLPNSGTWNYMENEHYTHCKSYF